MAHGYRGVKEQYLDNLASRFAEAGFVVLVFDYRDLGASEVDATRIGAWGTSCRGGHVVHLAAFEW